MTYDASKYRALGVGDKILGSHLWWDATNGFAHSVGNEEIGEFIGADTERVYLEALPNKDVYASGAARSQAEGRGRFDLVPFEAMLSLARRYELGAKLFGDKNWEKGQPLSRLLSSMRRHAHQIGYDYSEDHAGAVLWNAAAFVTMVERMRAGILPKELDDIGYFMNEKATNQQS